MHKVGLALLLFLTWGSMCAQGDPFVSVIARVRKDSLCLRWAPSTPVGWQLGNKYGYTIKRFKMAKFQEAKMDSLMALEEKVLSPYPLKPLPENQWENLAKRNPRAAIAVQAIYGGKFLVKGPQVDNMQFYQQSEEQQLRYSYGLLVADLSREVSLAMGLRWEEAIPDTAFQYAYQVSLALPSDHSYPIDHGTIIVDPSVSVDLPAPEEVKAEFGDQVATLTWNSFYQRALYSAYYVERSEDNGKTFKDVLNGQPFLNTTTLPEFPHRVIFMDSLPQNMKVYQYRVKGITPFGELGPPSEIVQGTGLNTLTGIVPVIQSVSFIDEDKLHVRWRFPEEELHHVKSFQVGSASSVKGPFQVIREGIDRSTFEYVDENPNDVNYYVVKAVGEDGKITTSFPYLMQLEDETPPDPPMQVSGSIDSLGIVNLSWKPNAELDLVGYRIYRANTLYEEPVQISSSVIRTSYFRDSISVFNLTPKICYWVVALDNHFNPSDYSEPSILEKPDIVPPAPVVITEAISEGEAIRLAWTPSSSRDVSSYIVFRDGKERFRIAAQDSTFSILDKKVEKAVSYVYSVTVEDVHGLQTSSVNIKVTYIDNGYRPSIKKILQEIDREKRTITLRWNYLEHDVRGYQVFRRVGGGPLRLHQYVTNTSYVDRNLGVSEVYEYRIKALFHSGAESNLSQGVEVKF